MYDVIVCVCERRCEGGEDVVSMLYNCEDDVVRGNLRRLRDGDVKRCWFNVL